MSADEAAVFWVSETRGKSNTNRRSGIHFSVQAGGSSPNAVTGEGPVGSSPATLASVWKGGGLVTDALHVASPKVPNARSGR